MIHVRPATEEDIPWIINELHAFAKFLGTTRELFPSDDYAKEQLQMMIEQHVFCIAESDIANAHDGTRIGFIAGLCSPHFFNPEIRVLTEIFWWVMPEWRKTRAGAMLFQEFLHAGKVRADMVIMSLEENSPVNEETFTKRGFKMYERSFILEVK